MISVCRSCLYILPSLGDFPCWTITSVLARVEARTISKHPSWFIHFVLINSELKMRCLYAFRVVNLFGRRVQFPAPELLGDFLRWPNAYFVAFISTRSNLFHSTFSNWWKLWNITMNSLYTFTRERSHVLYYFIGSIRGSPRFEVT